MKRMLILLGLALAGCGGGSTLQKAAVAPAPVSAPSAPPVTTPPLPTTPPIIPPAPTLIGQGQGIRIDSSSGVVGWTSGSVTRTSAGDSFIGTLVELAGGHALTMVNNSDATAEAYVDGSLAETVPQNPSIIALSEGNVIVALAGALEISPDGSAWVAADCSVWFGGAQLAVDPDGCPLGVKVLRGLEGDVYVGWCDGAGVVVVGVLSGGRQETIHPVSGAVGVYGFDFAITSQDFLAVAWVQEVEGEDGSSVWYQEPGIAPERLSAKVKEGFSGAGNPVVLGAGVVAFLDDTKGTQPGHFDVFEGDIEGSLSALRDVSNSDLGIDELVGAGSTIAWSDETDVWSYQVQ